ncbi:uncharacterized protein V1513DRAFT_374789 [Lipomyces chichibuensis]|uniref:uncharacterized protein n=1 Tax=Lipomyces chichibuensis TaxID=1546026 RepID=UPI00334397BB
MFQVLGPSASPVKQIILPTSSPDRIDQYMLRPLDDHVYITTPAASKESHSRPTPRHKVGRPRKNKAGIIAIVPPADSALRLPNAAGPQTPPPTASRAHHDPLRSQIPATPQSNQRQTTGSKTVPRALITPQSSSRPHSLDLSLSSDRTWRSSSPLTSPAGNGLGIFVNHPNQPPHDVDPSMIYPDQDVQAFNKYTTYTTLFRSPIQYPPYLGQRSLSNFEALSSSTMYGKEHKRTRTRTRTRSSENGKFLSPTVANQPQTPPSNIYFAISETGQAIIECKESPATPESRSRVLSSSTSISTLSTSASASASDDRDSDGVSEAETEIFDPKRDLMRHSDARVAMAKVIRRQQALLRQYREQMAIGEPQNEDNSEQSGKYLRHHHNSVVSCDAMPSEKPRACQMNVANSMPMPDCQTQSSAPVRHQEPFASQQLRVEGEQSLGRQRFAGVHEQQQQQRQPQVQQLQSQAQEAQKELPKRKRGRPPKKQQCKRQSDDGVTRCVCGHNGFFGTPMVQCDSCTNWLHMPCVNLDPRVPIVGPWYCPLCTCGVPAGA